MRTKSSTACGTRMVRGYPRTISLVAFIRRVVAGVALRHGVYHRLQGLVVGSHILWAGGHPHVSGECSKGFPFFFIYRKEEGELIIGVFKGWILKIIIIILTLSVKKSCYLDLSDDRARFSSF